MASAGTKRPLSPHDRDGAESSSSRGHERRDKPKDWRDAFLDESPRRHSSDDRDRDRDRERDRSGRDHRNGHGSRYDRDRREDRYRDRSRDGDRHRDERRGMSRDHWSQRDYKREDHHREREHRGDRAPSSQRHGDTRDRRGNTAGFGEREEGEIEGSPEKRGAELPPVASSSRAVTRSPRDARSGSMNNGQDGSRGGFKAIKIPTGPKAGVSGPSTTGANVFDQSARPSEGNGLAEGTQPTKFEEPIVVLEEERDPEKVLEERRRKREEIMAKFKSKVSNTALSPAKTADNAPIGTGADSVTTAGMQTTERTGIMTGTPTGATPLLRQLGTRSTTEGLDKASTPLNQPSIAPTPQGHDLDLSKHGEEKQEVAQVVEDDGPGISAADYDPTADREKDEQKRQKDVEVAEGVGEPIVVDDKPAEEEYEEVEMEVEDEDDEEVDMFAAFGGEEKPKKMRKVTVRRLKNGTGDSSKVEIIKPTKAKVLEVVDNVDDTDGYYRITPGEILDDGRYQITITLGKGMFSAVVKAKVLKAVGQERRQDVVGREVAIKLIRSQQAMYSVGKKEAGILKKLNDADPEDKRHIVRLEHVFDHRGHLCIVTESLSMNLRDVIKRFGKDVGLNMRAVRAYAHQLFLSLSLMRKCSVVHADIKPDNILASENKGLLKVCDFGSASDVSEGEITPYLVSRFYRAPEISESSQCRPCDADPCPVLGLPYDTAIDIWSVGCTLYELYTGKILFPGRSNNHMLLLMMETKGKISHRLIKKATFGEMHFDESNNFISIERDKITGQDVAKTLVISKPTRDLRSRLLPASSVQLKMKDDELKQLLHFVDLLDKCLQMDASRRISPREALVHPFLTA